MATAMPDLEPVVINWLRNDARLTDLVAPVRINTSMRTGDNHTWVLVSRSGGATVMRGWAREPVFTVHCYGTTSADPVGRAEASGVASQAQRAVEDLTGQVTGAVVFGAVDVVSDLVWLPDPSFLPWRARYVFTFRAVCHPTTT